MTPGPGAWLAVGARPGRPASSLKPLEARLRDLGWRRVSRTPAIWIPAGGGPPVLSLGPAGALIGRFHGLLPALDPDASPKESAERLMAAGWGRWVAILPRPDGIAVLRDPSGALDAFLWRRGALWIAASDAHESLDGLLPEEARLDLTRVRAMLDHPAAASGAAAIQEIHAVPPGGGVVLPADGVPAVFQIWTPARAAQRAAAPADLRLAVDDAVRVLLASHPRFVGEISGGFDSALVATSAAAQGLAGGARAWLNFHAVEPEADERRWARAVARHAGLALTEQAKTPKALTLADLNRLTGGLRPALQGLDVEYDEAAAEQMRDAPALLTGQGGDAVFFQYGTPAVAIDRVRRLGLRGLDPRFLHDLGRWTRHSAWGIAGGVLRDRLGLPPRTDPEADAPPGPDIHPWLADLESLPPAKRGQVRQLVNTQIFHGDCLRVRAGELLHPLLTQPVMEAGLGIPADRLVEGGRDRALARRLFADRLPADILDRRGKGELSGYYGEVVRLSLPLARELLLDGALLDMGLLDRDDVVATLDPHRLIADGAYNLILIRLVLELWLGRWRARLAARREPLVQPGDHAGV